MMSATMQLVYYILLATVALGGLLFVLETIEAGKRFVSINMGKRVEYYGSNVFHSLYRVTSIPGTLDYTIRPVKPKAVKG